MKKNKGITLIALVVTIVVLLILAAVSISMLTGENGIIRQAQASKEKTEIGEEKEYVNISVSAVRTKKIVNGDTSDITSEELQEEINQYTSEAIVTGSGILCVKYNSGRLYYVDGQGNGDEMYNVSGLEGKIAPTDLFDYEIIDETTKTAGILRIKPEYCNSSGFNPETEKYELEDTNYEIIYKGEKISDTLVIPYQVEIDGEIYIITEVNIYAQGGGPEKTNGYGFSFPRIETIIYPNTVEKIKGKSCGDTAESANSDLKEVVLSNVLKEIGDYAFYNCDGLTGIEIPESVSNIGKGAFCGCLNLCDIEIPENVTTIGAYAFCACQNLGPKYDLIGCYYGNGLTIPNSVTSIGEHAFWGCKRLYRITIPESVTSIGQSAFAKELSVVNYRGTEEQWNAISIGDNNDYLKNATINYNYTGE